MYKDFYSERITKKLAKIKKKNPKHYEVIDKKINDILNNPRHKYKNLHYSMKGMKRVHIGHFVLIFKISHIRRHIFFEDYAHHDKIYN